MIWPGEKQSIYLFGESHVHVFDNWWGRQNEAGDLAKYELHVKPLKSFNDLAQIDGDGKVRLNAVDKENLVEFGIYPFDSFLKSERHKNSFLIFIIGSSACYNHLYTANWDGLDFCAPRLTSIDTSLEGRLIPYDLLTKRIDERITPIRLAIELFAKETDQKLIVLSPPPPHRHNEQARQFLQNLFPDHDYKLPRPIIRLKLQSMYHERILEICNSNGLKFFDTWLETSDDDGFLKEDYEFDGFHCSLPYAEYVLRRLEEEVLEPERISKI
jgi:hypothetical protein